MTLFQIYSGLTLVGWSALEDGDPSMGVATGQFKPAEAYDVIKNECRSSRIEQSSLGLSVQTASGVTIPCAGVNISDYSQELGDGCIDITILGVPHPLYEELFPRQVGVYASQFDNQTKSGGLWGVESRGCAPLQKVALIAIFQSQKSIRTTLRQRHHEQEKPRRCRLGLCRKMIDDAHLSAQRV
ncbi:hypothetical protein [Pseudomonas sp. ZS1P83]